MPYNVIAILISGFANMVVGFIWYGPLFATAWMKENKFKEEDLKDGNNSSYFLLSLLH